VFMNPTYRLFVSERGNIFMTEIAAVLADALADRGYDTVFPAPGLPERSRNNINLVIAPHEFFPLQQEYTETELLRAAEASIAVGVEQPGTSWFDLGTHYASLGPITLDINPFAVRQLESLGVEALHLQLGYHESWDRWGGNPDHARPTDLLFLGSVTDRRDRLLSEAAPLLWDCHADLRLFEFPRPMTVPRSHFVASNEKWDVLTSSRILLNIHRDEVPYFEWVRVLEAVCNGCLVITESSSDYGPLLPGEHLIAAPSDALGAYAASMLIDETLRAELAGAAYDFARTKLDLTSLLEPICARIETATLSSPTRRTMIPFQRPHRSSAEARPELLEDVLTTERSVWARVKELLDGETELLRRVEALEARLLHGSADHAAMTTTGAWDDFHPDVSVVITSYNYSAFITEAIMSVLSTQGIDTELIIVDDHSDDDSVAQIRKLMNRTNWFPMVLVARAANAGVGAARDTGIAIARADRVFILDADNTIYPNSLRKLSVALDANPDAAFSYGIITKIGELGLLSYLPWDVERLTKGNYIDAMAMIRRDIWNTFGGYDTECSLLGWEDYELWLRLAAGGCSAAFVPEIVGNYRVHSTSRQQTVNLDTLPLMRDFQQRYPFLPWEH